MLTTENKALAYRYYQELLNGGDLSFIDKYMAPEFEFTNPTHPEPYRGKQFKQLVAMLHAAFPDIHFTVEHLVAEDDVVVGRWTACGTHTGTPLSTLRGDIPAQGKPFSICGMSWLRIMNGKFMEARILEDTLGLLQQLGVTACFDTSPAKDAGIPSDFHALTPVDRRNNSVNQGFHIRLFSQAPRFA